MNTNTDKKIVVIHHSADFDGLFCREIARKFLGETAEYIGWDFKDKPLSLQSFPDTTQFYVLDLPVDRVFGFAFAGPDEDIILMKWLSSVVWIDHHKSSIESHPPEISGYRIDGVAACRLTWQWFVGKDKMEQRRNIGLPPLPLKEEFIARKLDEPYAVQLAGEYDIWDKRNPDADVFQFALRSSGLTPHIWSMLLDPEIDRSLHGTGMEQTNSFLICASLLEDGRMLQRYQQQSDASVMSRSFMVEFEGLKFLALNTARCNSITFAAKDMPETGHDALMGFYWDGTKLNVSMYHANHRKDLDLSEIASKYGGGGHRGACGMRIDSLPFFK